MLDFLQSRWMTGTTQSQMLANADVLENPGTVSTTLGTLTLMPLSGANTTNGTLNPGGSATIFADYYVDTVVDNQGYNTLVYTSGQSSSNPSQTNDSVSSQTLTYAKRRRFSRWV